MSHRINKVIRIKLLTGSLGFGTLPDPLTDGKAEFWTVYLSGVTGTGCVTTEHDKSDAETSQIESIESNFRPVARSGQVSETNPVSALFYIPLLLSIKTLITTFREIPSEDK